MKKLGALILGAILTIGIGAGISVNPRTDVAHADYSKAFVFSKYAAGTQYATNEVHELSASNPKVTVTTTECHFTSELRIYSSNSHNGYAIFESDTGVNSMTINMGNKVDTLNVYYSNSSTFEDYEAVSVTSTSYNDYTVEFDNYYTWFKFDVVGANQVRVKSVTMNFYQEEDPNAATSIELNKTKALTTVGDTVELTATVGPETALDKTVNWTSSDETVATVDENGLVTVKATGYAKITAKANGGPGLDASCIIASTINDGLTEATAFDAREAYGYGYYQGETASTTEFYVKGTLSVVKDVDTKYGNVELTISKDGYDFIFYRLKNQGGANLTEQIFEVGDEIIAKGKIKAHGGIKPELDSNCTLVTFTANTVANRISELAGGWNNNVATAECSTKYTTTKKLILTLSTAELNTFKTSEDAEIASARAAYENWCNVNGDKTPYEGAIVDAAQVALVMTNNNVTVMIIILASVLALAAAALLISKKRRLAK